MKKIFLLLLSIIAINLTSKASTYKLNNVAIETQFSAASEMNIDQVLQQAMWVYNPAEGTVVKSKNKTTAAILGILCGGFGIHRFYLGHSKSGLIHLAIALCASPLAVVPVVGWLALSAIESLNWISSAVDGVMYLIATDDEFKAKYANNPKLLVWLSDLKSATSDAPAKTDAPKK
jgi:TM2 domain-containing membrane protein YozV